ncbi:Separase [Camellia lanceoleosa]|uniref:Separase n=1 Tax=Camellia lanceoleosa TaxID=1840588 RepID=A0ACC0J102_9ERIC|nr:Separase [Camellia lanceoleosa]
MMMMMMNQSSSKRFSRWARKRRVLSKCRAGCSEIPKGRLISSGIQGLMSSYLPFEPCDEDYSSKGLCSSDFFGDNDASDNDTNSGSGILFEDKICVKRWHCPWGSTVVDYIAPVFRLILEENYLSSSMQPLEDTKKNRSLWLMQKKSLDQRLGKFLRDLEDSWFGPIVQFLLLGEWSGCEHQESQKKLMHNLKVKCKVDAHESLIKVIIGGAKHICEREESILQLILNKGCFIDGVGYCNQETWGTYADTSDGVESLSKKALKLILEAAREVEEEECLNREPVILVCREAKIMQVLDGQSIEPVWYMPVIPLVLVNGSEDDWYCVAFLSVQMFDMMGSASCSTPITEKSVLRDHRPLPLGEDDYLRGFDSGANTDAIWKAIDHFHDYGGMKQCQLFCADQIFTASQFYIPSKIEFSQFLGYGSTAVELLTRCLANYALL